MRGKVNENDVIVITVQINLNVFHENNRLHAVQTRSKIREQHKRSGAWD
jgi:hypothetical protein